MGVNWHVGARRGDGQRLFFSKPFICLFQIRIHLNTCPWEQGLGLCRFPLLSFYLVTFSPRSLSLKVNCTC